MVGAQTNLDDDFFSTKSSSSGPLDIPIIPMFSGFYITGNCGSSQNIQFGGHNLTSIDKIEFRDKNAGVLDFDVPSSSFSAVSGFDLDTAISFSVGPIAGAGGGDQWDAIIHTVSGKEIVVLNAGSCGP